MKYLGIEPLKPRIAVFDFTCCEGCELQFANKEETLVEFLNTVQIVNFREISSDHSSEYDIAFIEGAVSRYDEAERLREIRKKTGMLIALGSCACFGGVNTLKNIFNLEDANREVYGDSPKETLPVHRIRDVVKVDFEIPGCPVSKAEVERIVQHIIWEVPYEFPGYPVCLECKQRYTTCVFEKGHLCLGSITRGGCNAPCPAGGLGCWGCRGPSPDCNMEEFLRLSEEKDFGRKEIEERLSFFGGFRVSA